VNDTSNPEDGPRRRREAVEAVLRQHAGPRARVVDDQGCEVAEAGSRGTFRVQLFTGPGLRPVAVATQVMGEGLSLVNGAERFAAAVWRRHLPEEPEPPLWVERQLPPGDEPAAGGAGGGRFSLVRFELGGRFGLCRPSWLGLTGPELARLVGGPVDLSRGEGYRPWPVEPEPQLRFRTAWVVALPRPEPFRESACMSAGVRWWRRLGRQVVGRRRRRDCCWYHGGNWHRVSRLAARLVRQARQEGAVGNDVADRARAAAAAAGVAGWEAEALDSLLMPYDGLILERDDDLRRVYVNGQHRAQALLDAGVHRTVRQEFRQVNRPGSR
jgi:hypothetical protein